MIYLLAPNYNSHFPFSTAIAKHPNRTEKPEYPPKPF